MDIVIDIHGYYGLKNQPFIKELAILSVQANNSNVFIDKHCLFTPPYRWELLSKSCQNDYLRMFNIHGIPWQLGFFKADLQVSILRNNIKNAKCIYLFDNNIKKFLSKITRKINKKRILCLSKRGFYIKINKFQTQCNHHQYPKYNNCAYDNAMKMRSWIIQKLLKKNKKINIPHILKVKKNKRKLSKLKSKLSYKLSCR
ncbi:putative Bracovirus protein MdBV-1-10 [Microplitis demolitor]